MAVVDDQRGSPTYVGHLAAATRAGRPPARTASTTSRPTATRPGPTSPRRSSRRPGSTRACGGSRPAELDPPRQAPRPAYSVLRSEKGAPDAAALARRPARVPRGDPASRRRIAREAATRSSPPGSSTRRATTSGTRSTRSSAGRSGGAASGASSSSRRATPDGIGALYRARVAQRHPVPGPLRRRGSRGSSRRT